MHPPWFFALLILLAMPCLAETEKSEVIRAGLVAEESTIEALLLAKLGKIDGFEIFSRTDLPALEREAELYAKKGTMHLKGLDRLILIRKIGGDFSVRVADCATGTVTYEASLPPGLDAAALSELLAMRLPRHLQSSPREDAQCIALLGFRFPVSSAENRALEARLNLACTVALQGSREAVVLERWRMKDLVFENSLRVKAINPFWNATAMVEGAISREKNRLIVSFVVKTPSGDDKRSGRVEGTVEDLAEVGRELAAAILKMPTQPTGTSQSESQAYLAEADWLLNHSLYTEAVQAVESAVALDPGSRNAAIRRIRAYAMSAYPDDLGIRQRFAVHGHQGKITNENVGRSVAMAAEMSRLMEDYLARYPTQNKDTLEDPVSLGVRTLTTSLRTLTAAYDHDYYSADPEGVEALRASVERIGRLLREKSVAIFRSSVDRYLTLYAGYWCATPEATLAEYRAALSRDFESGFPNSWPVALRISLVMPGGKIFPLLDVDEGNLRKAQSDWTFRRMVSWEPGDETRLRNLWEAFLNEMSASEDLLHQADALYFRWSSLAEFTNREKALGAIIDFLEKHPAAMGSEDGRATAQMLIAPLRDLSNVRNGQLCVRYVEVLVKLFEQDSMVPYEMVQMLPQTFGYLRNDDILPGNLVRLVEVMERHLAKWKGRKDDYYTRILGDAISGLRGISAKGGTKSETRRDEKIAAPVLKVTRLWPQQRYLQGQGRLNGHSGALVEGKLWFSQRTPLGFWKIDPHTFETEYFDSPEPPPGISNVNSNSRPFFKDGRIFVSAGEDVWSYDPVTKRWRDLGLPGAEYFLFEANGLLWAIYGKGPFGKNAKGEDQGTGLYRLDTKDLTGTLVFSTRRRPAENPLDLTDISAPFGVFSGLDGQPIVGLVGKDWKLLSLKDGEPWPLNRPKMYQGGVFLPEGALVVQKERQPVSGRNSPLFDSLISVDPRGHSELLLRHLDSPEGRDLSDFGHPVWTVPKNLTIAPATGIRYFHPLLNGKRLVLFVADVEGSTEDFTSSAELVVFERGRREAVHIPLRFEIPGDFAHHLAEGRRNMTQKAMNPRPIFNDFLGNSAGFIYTGEWGFWFIPMADFERALADAVRLSAGG